MMVMVMVMVMMMMMILMIIIIVIIIISGFSHFSTHLSSHFSAVETLFPASSVVGDPLSVFFPIFDTAGPSAVPHSDRSSVRHWWRYPNWWPFEGKVIYIFVFIYIFVKHGMEFGWNGYCIQTSQYTIFHSVLFPQVPCNLTRTNKEPK